MMMMTVTSPHSASRTILGTSLSGVGSDTGKLRLCAVHTTRPIRQAPNRSPGRMPARNRLATEIVPPAATE